jgi:hypothetical protein
MEASGRGDEDEWLPAASCRDPSPRRLPQAAGLISRSLGASDTRKFAAAEEPATGRPYGKSASGSRGRWMASAAKRKQTPPGLGHGRRCCFCTAMPSLGGDRSNQATAALRQKLPDYRDRVVALETK